MTNEYDEAPNVTPWGGSVATAPEEDAAPNVAGWLPSLPQYVPEPTYDAPDVAPNATSWMSVAAGIPSVSRETYDPYSREALSTPAMPPPQSYYSASASPRETLGNIGRAAYETGEALGLIWPEQTPEELAVERQYIDAGQLSPRMLEQAQSLVLGTIGNVPHLPGAGGGKLTQEVVDALVTRKMREGLTPQQAMRDPDVADAIARLFSPDLNAVPDAPATASDINVNLRRAREQDMAAAREGFSSGGVDKNTADSYEQALHQQNWLRQTGTPDVRYGDAPLSEDAAANIARSRAENEAVIDRIKARTTPEQFAQMDASVRTKVLQRIDDEMQRERASLEDVRSQIAKYTPGSPGHTSYLHSESDHLKQLRDLEATRAEWSKGIATSPTRLTPAQIRAQAMEKARQPRVGTEETGQQAIRGMIEEGKRLLSDESGQASVGAVLRPGVTNALGAAGGGIAGNAATPEDASGGERLRNVMLGALAGLGATALGRRFPSERGSFELGPRGETPTLVSPMMDSFNMPTAEELAERVAKLRAELTVDRAHGNPTRSAANIARMEKIGELQALQAIRYRIMQAGGDMFAALDEINEYANRLANEAELLADRSARGFMERSTERLRTQGGRANARATRNMEGGEGSGVLGRSRITQEMSITGGDEAPLIARGEADALQRYLDTVGLEMRDPATFPAPRTAPAAAAPPMRPTQQAMPPRTPAPILGPGAGGPLDDLMPRTPRPPVEPPSPPTNKALAQQPQPPDDNAIVKQWTAGNRAILDRIGKDREFLVNLNAALTGDVPDSFLTAALHRKAILRSALEDAGFTTEQIKEATDAAFKNEMTRRYGATLPDRVKSMLASTQSNLPDGELSGLDTFVQRWKNTTFGLGDIGVFGVQGFNAIRRGGIPMLAGQINRTLGAMNMPHIATDLIESQLPRTTQRILDGVHQGIGSSGAMPEVGTLLSYLGKYGKAADRKYVIPASDFMTRIQFQNVLGSLRNLSYDGDLVLLKALGRDIQNPRVRAEAAANANVLSSFAESALNAGRRSFENKAFTSASMSRARVRSITQMAKLITPGASIEQRILAAITIASTYGLYTMFAKALNDQIGVGELEMDPSKLGAHVITSRFKNREGQNIKIDVVPQDAVERAFALSLRALRDPEVDDAQIQRSWERVLLGSGSVLTRGGLAAGFRTGFEPGQGYKYGDLSRSGAIQSVLPIPPLAGAVAQGGTTPLELGLSGLGVGNYPDTRPESLRAGDYAGMRGENQLNVVPQEAWRQVLELAPSLAQYSDVYAWREARTAEETARAQAMSPEEAQRRVAAATTKKAQDALDPLVKAVASGRSGELEAAIAKIINADPVDKAFDKVVEQVEEQWVRENPQLTLSLYDQYKAMSGAEQAKHRSWNFNQKQRELAQSLVAEGQRTPEGRALEPVGAR